MAHPTSNGLMNACEEAIKKKIEYQRGGTYVVMEGPQFSTLAESNLYRSWKADVIDDKYARGKISKRSRDKICISRNGY